MCFSGWDACPVLSPGHWVIHLNKPPEQPKQWGSAPCSCTHQTWQETKERNQQRYLASFIHFFYYYLFFYFCTQNRGYSQIWIILNIFIDTFPCLMSYKYIHNLHSPPSWNICSSELVTMHNGMVFSTKDIGKCSLRNWPKEGILGNSITYDPIKYCL